MNIFKRVRSKPLFPSLSSKKVYIMMWKEVFLYLTKFMKIF